MIRLVAAVVPTASTAAVAAGHLRRFKFAAGFLFTAAANVGRVPGGGKDIRRVVAPLLLQQQIGSGRVKREEQGDHRWRRSDLLQCYNEACDVIERMAWLWWRVMRRACLLSPAAEYDASSLLASDRSRTAAGPSSCFDFEAAAAACTCGASWNDGVCDQRTERGTRSNDRCQLVKLFGAGFPVAIIKRLLLTMQPSPLPSYRFCHNQRKQKRHSGDQGCVLSCCNKDCFNRALAIVEIFPSSRRRNDTRTSSKTPTEEHKSAKQKSSSAWLFCVGLLTCVFLRASHQEHRLPDDLLVEAL